MAICRICKEEFYSETISDPAEKCLCGEMCRCDLWSWDKHRAYIKWFRYSVARLLWRLSQFIIRDNVYNKS